MSEQRGAKARKKEREDLWGRYKKKKKCNLNSEMTEEVKICFVVTTVSPTAENPRDRERQRQRDNANVMDIHSHPLYYLSSE